MARITATAAADASGPPPNYEALDTGLADINHKQRLVVSYNWKLPTPNNNFALKMIAGGWETTGVIQTQTGDPLTVLAGVDESQTGLGRDRAVTVSGQSAYGAGACKTGAICRNWINPSAFALPAVGTYGTVAKGSYIGPAYTNWDAGLFRVFQIHEAVNLTFRAEYFDVLNHTELADPGTTVNSGGFGSITAVQTSGGYPISRIGQLALKLVF
jgi:hypothetical protein